MNNAEFLKGWKRFDLIVFALSGAVIIVNLWLMISRIIDVNTVVAHDGSLRINYYWLWQSAFFSFFTIVCTAALLWLRKASGLPRTPRTILGILFFLAILGRPLIGVFTFDLSDYLPNWLTYFISPILFPLSGLLSIIGVNIVIGAIIIGVALVPIFLYSIITFYVDSLKQYSVAEEGLWGALGTLERWVNGESAEEMPDDSKGARHAISKEIEAISAKDNPKAFDFGHIAGSPLPLHTEKHILIMASTRSGKGVSLIIPHLLRYSGSAFVLDPKGENARATGRHRAEINGKVHYLDPFGITGKPQARFNPLARFTPENMEAESKALAAALVMGERGVRDHWTASAQQLLAAFILHVVTSPDVPPENKDLPTVRRLLLRDLNQVFKAMRDSEAADGLLSESGALFRRYPGKRIRLHHFHGAKGNGDPRQPFDHRLPERRRCRG